MIGDYFWLCVIGGIFAVLYFAPSILSRKPKQKYDGGFFDNGSTDWGGGIDGKGGIYDDTTN